MPVNLVSAFGDGSISYNLMASLFRDSTGNQILDGTKADGKKPQYLPLGALPSSINTEKGFYVAANN